MSTSSDPSGTRDNPSDEVSEGEDSVALRLSLPPDRADRLRAVAQKLGLTPSLVAKRAIELVCDEVETVHKDPRSTDVLIDEYQARLDLLHAVDAPENGQLKPADE